ncbi:MAG: hypothetical protein CBB71_00695 [Rhodopirellula sp. TMED11]|nr:MAG: hypothetical protein CBB71_00695 [Rhodopirellula sp. TMED11]
MHHIQDVSFIGRGQFLVDESPIDVAKSTQIPYCEFVVVSDLEIQPRVRQQPIGRSRKRKQ